MVPGSATLASASRPTGTGGPELRRRHAERLGRAGTLASALLLAAGLAAFAGAAPAGAATTPNPGIPAGAATTTAGATSATTPGTLAGRAAGVAHLDTPPAWAAPVEAPLPPDAGSPPPDDTTAVTCTGAGACTAIGDLVTRSGNTVGLVATESAGGWSAIEAPLPPGAAANPMVTLSAVSCPAAGSCAAVGSYDDGASIPEGLLLSESSGTWTATEAPLPAGAGTPLAVTVSAVSCPVAGSCFAVGDYQDSANALTHGLLLSESGGKWSAAAAPLPAEAGSKPQGVSITALACTSSTACVAGGYYLDSTSIPQGLLLTRSGSSWTASVPPAPAGVTGAQLVEIAAVSCPAPGSCVAAGTYEDGSSNGQGMLLSQATGWSAVTAPLPAGAAANPMVVLAALTCPSVGTCAASGDYADASGNQQGLLLALASGNWSATRAPQPADAAPAAVVTIPAVSCTGPGSCAAVGTYLDVNDVTAGLLLSQSAGSWTAERVPLPADAAADQSSSMTDVACPATGACAATGGYANASGASEGLLVALGGGAWSDAGAPVPAGDGGNAQASLDAISCPSAGDCAAAGTYVDAAGNGQGLLLDETSGTWNAHEAPLPAGAAVDPAVSVDAISCPAAGACTAAGTYTDATGKVEGELLTLASGTWTALTAPLPAGTATNPDVQIAVGGLSCAQDGTCAAVGTYADASGFAQGLLLSGSGSSWTATEAPLPPGAASDPEVVLGAVSCPADSSCEAAGEYGDTANAEQGVLLEQSAGGWSATEAPLPPAGTSPGVVLDSISCPAAGSCVAGGLYEDGADHQQGLLLSLSSNTWSAAPAPLPPAATDPVGSVGAVSCATAGACVAAGGYVDGGGAARGVLLTLASGTWTAAAAPLPVGAAADPLVTLSGLECTGSGSCLAAGSYVDGDGDAQGLLLSASAGSWTATEAPLPAGAGTVPAARFGAVSCSDATDCAAAGSYLDGSGFSQGLVDATASPTTTSVAASTTTPVVGAPVTVTATVAATRGDPSGGTVAFSDALGPIAGCTAQPVSADQATCTTSFVPAGSYTVTATYAANAQHAESSGTVGIVASRAAAHTTLKASIGAVTYGAEAAEVLTVAVARAPGVPAPTGTADVLAGTRPVCAVTLSASTGSGTCSPTNVTLAGGSYSLTATYVPGADPNYAGSTSPAQHLSVGRAKTTTSLTLSTSKLTYGHESFEVFTARVAGVAGGAAPTGTVVVKSGATALCTIRLAAGTGHCSPANVALTAGARSATATYVPGTDPDYLASGPTAGRSLTIGKDTTSTALKLSAPSTKYGRESLETFTAVVTGALLGVKPTGHVVVRQGTVVLCTVTLAAGTGHCALTAKQLKVGTYRVTATYVPGNDPNYLAAGSTPAQILTVKA